ncbi:hypothetical protein [Profundibacter sp.]
MEIKNSSILIAIILVIALPATTMVVAYMLTKNPALRPLARTLNDEAIYRGEAVAVEIVAHIRWTTGRQKSFTQRELSNVVQRAFRAHGVTARVVYETVNSTDPVTITYQVGRNTIGPSRINKAGDTVNNAVAVYRMYQMTTPVRR